MKTTLSAVALFLSLTLTAFAANSKKPAISQHRAGDPSILLQEPENNPHSVPPSLCSPCLFYGGDLNPGDINSVGFSDENTLLILGGSSTYAAVNIPTGVTATVYGILFNVQADAAFDPITASYDIRTGVADADGGTSIASGSGTAVIQPTGRNFIGLNEYTVAVSWSTPVTLTPGEYWFNLTPQCLNTLDGSCSVFRQFVSNTTQGANDIHGNWQPVHETFLNSLFFGVAWTNWCDASLGFNPTQCGYASFGLRGTK
ncbi:MAG: hypothetical protein WCC99_10455 [Candidatus Sulfotelmatobacter sp.]